MENIYHIFKDVDAPLQRAEHIVEHGPDEDAGPLPCEDEPEAQCLTFQVLNRMRTECAPCGCWRVGGGAITVCEEHGGSAVTQEEHRKWIDDANHEFGHLRAMAIALVEEE